LAAGAGEGGCGATALASWGHHNTKQVATNEPRSIEDRVIIGRILPVDISRDKARRLAWLAQSENQAISHCSPCAGVRSNATTGTSYQVSAISHQVLLISV